MRDLKNLREMGFTNVPMNVTAVKRFPGDITRAIDWLSSQSKGSATSATATTAGATNTTETSLGQSLLSLHAMGFMDDELNRKVGHPCYAMLCYAMLCLNSHDPPPPPQPPPPPRS